MTLMISDVSKSYKNNFFSLKKNRALSGINLEIESGSVLALVGQNGAGKTTLIKCLLNFIRPDTGRFQFDGYPISEMIKNGKLGYMPESLKYDSMFTMNEYISDLMILKGYSMCEYDERFNHLLSEFQMSKYLDKPLKNYSKGNMKKATFIQAIVHSPQLLVLDEPTDGLDPVSRRMLLNEILAIKKNGGTVIITTHILSDLAIVADKIVFLQNGKVICETKMNQINGSLDDWYLEKTMQYGGE